MESRFVSESPLRTFGRLADREIKGVATTSEVKTLHSNPVLWLDALVVMLHRTEVTITKSKLATQQEANGQGTAADHRRWAAIKREADRLNLPRWHFLGLVKARKLEVESIVGRRPIHSGNMIAFLQKTIQLVAQDENDAAVKMMRAMVRRLSNE